MNQDLDPYLMIILPRMFESITREMTFTLMKSARSGVINTARDFSSAIVTADGRLFMIEEGLPIQMGTIHLSVQNALKFFDDLVPGDCIMNNCPYTGNTHHAEITIMVPIFYEGELVFWAISRAHQADVGAPIPTTYPFTASDIYQEGIYLPCIRCQREYEDINDIIRMVRYKVRVPDQWYGDYLAQVGSARIGEKKVKELVEKYGIETIKTFIEKWFDYSEKLMIEEIKKLKPAELQGELKHDPPIMYPNGPYSPPGVTPEVADGIPMRAKMKIEPEKALITVDLRDNIENQPFGFNLCWSTTLAAVYAGIFNNINPQLPHNEGALKRIKILADEGKIAGKPKFPASTAVSTTNLADRLINLIGMLFAELGPPWGMAEGNPGIPISAAVVSGYDWRKPGEPGQVNYIDQLIITGGSGGGPAVAGYDGYIAYSQPCSGGVLNGDSVELNELRFPITYKEFGILTDSGGAGKYEGAPGGICIYGPRKHPMTAGYVTDGMVFAPKGVRGGKSGHPLVAKKLKIYSSGKVKERDIPPMGTITLTAGEYLKSIHGGGGGYGDPLERDPERVRIKVRDGLVSEEKARDVYGVIFKNVNEPEKIDIDYEATKQKRNQLAEEGEN